MNNEKEQQDTKQLLKERSFEDILEDLGSNGSVILSGRCIFQSYYTSIFKKTYILSPTRNATCPNQSCMTQIPLYHLILRTVEIFYVQDLLPWKKPVGFQLALSDNNVISLLFRG